MRPLRPVKITDETMENINSHAGRGHITEQEIREAIENSASIERNREEARADFVVTGQAVNGKKLSVYVTFT